MRGYVFEIPFWIIPKDKYELKGFNTYFVPARSKLKKSDFYQPPSYTKVISFAGEEETPKLVKELVIFSMFLNQNYHAIQWLQDFSEYHINKYLLEFDDVDQLTKSIQDEHSMHIVDYNKYPLLEIIHDRLTIDFARVFGLFYGETEKESKKTRIKNLIKYYAFIQSSKMLQNKVYDNSYAYITSLFNIVEALINIDIAEQSEKYECSNCGSESLGKKSMSKLIYQFVHNNHRIPNKLKDLWVKIMRKHYTVRNKFSHNVSFKNVNDELMSIIKTKESNEVTIYDEIEHGEGLHIGANAMSEFIRRELLHRLSDNQ